MVKPASRESNVAASVARRAAFDILLRVERESSYASELLHSRSYRSLSTVDHALATELVMGVVRWRPLLDAQIAQASSQSLQKLDLEVLTALRLGVYQLGWLTRIPPRAAIHESVELVKHARKRSAVPFVNAILRKIAPGSSSGLASIPSTSVEALAAGSAHPLWLVQRWAKAYGLEAAASICRYNQSLPARTIRLRTPKAEGHLRVEGIDLTPGSLLASTRLVDRGDITKSSVLRSRECVLQEEASQLVACLVGHGNKILDCCAAPGGKALFLADRNPESFIVAAELHPHRARLLHNLVQAKSEAGQPACARVNVISADTTALPLKAKFDRVLADVPCSGTGTLSRNPEIKWRLKLHDLADLQSRQIAILRSAMNYVAPGGKIVYSTCSLEREENEDVIELGLKENSSFRIIDCAEELRLLQHEGKLVFNGPSSLTIGPYLRTLPGVHACDGFFAAILERKN
jgi:16S rRNA (cytosine967-C5)-methyltransferase